MKPIDSIVSSEYPAKYKLSPNTIVIPVNNKSIIITDMNEEIVFLFVPFKKNWIIILIIIVITRVGMVGLKPQPVIITNINNNARLKYILRKVFIPLLPPIISNSIRRIIVNSFIILYPSFYT